MTINHDSDCTTITQSDLAMFKCIAEPEIVRLSVQCQQ